MCKRFAHAQSVPPYYSHGSRSRSRSAAGQGGEIAQYHHNLAHNLKDLGTIVEPHTSSSSKLPLVVLVGGEV